MSLVQSGGVVTLTSGQESFGNVIASGGVEIVSSGAIASGTIVDNGGVLVVLAGGSAIGTVVSGGQVVSTGDVLVTSAGASVLALSTYNVTSVNVVSGAALIALQNGMASGSILDATISAGGSATVAGTGYVLSMALSSGSVVSALDHGQINTLKLQTGASATVGNGGGMYAGAQLGFVNAKSGGSVAVSGGGQIALLNLASGASATVGSGGYLGQVALSSGGSVTAVSGSLIASAALSSGGLLAIQAGASATNVTVSRGGIATVASGASFGSLSVGSGATVDISSGAGVGTISVASGATLIAEAGVPLSNVQVQGGGSLLAVTSGTSELIGGVLIQGAQSFSEGNGLIVSGSFIDLNPVSAAVALISWGDGTTSSATVSEQGGSGTFVASHAYTQDVPTNLVNTDSVLATVTDGGSVLATETAVLSVHNVAPVIQQLVASTPGQTNTSVTVNLGGSVTVTGQVSDADTLDTETVTLAWGDGTSSTAVVSQVNGIELFTGTHAYTNVSAQTALVQESITASATSEAGLVGSGTIAVQVANPAPVISGLVTNVPTITAGGTVTLSGQVSDSNANDAQTVLIDWGDNSQSKAFVTEVNGSGTFTAAHSYVSGTESLPNNAVKISATATSADGLTASAFTYETVTPTAPVLAPLILSAATLQEGQTLTLSENFSDPSGLLYDTATVVWGDGMTSQATVKEQADGTGVLTASHLYNGDIPTNLTNIDTIVVTLADPDGLSATSTSTLKVANVAPVVSKLVLSQGSINPGGSVTVTGMVSNPNLRDVQTVNVAWGDGAVSAATISVANGSATFSAGHTYSTTPPAQPIGGFVITATATSSDGQQGSASASEVVAGVLMQSTGAIQEGQSLTVSGNFVDQNPAAPVSAQINWGDGTVSAATVNETNGVGSFVASHVFVGDVPTRLINTDRVTATVTDPAGTLETEVCSVSVSAVAPVLSGVVSSSATVYEGNTVTLSGTVTNADLLDRPTVNVVWGDGNNSAGTIAVSNGVVTFSATHIYSAPSALQLGGSFPVVVTATSQVGLQASTTASETVLNVLTQNATTISEGQTLQISAGFTDPNPLHPAVATISWGDGTMSLASVTESGGTGSMSASHVYAGDVPTNVVNGDSILATFSDNGTVFLTTPGFVSVSSVAPTLSNLVLSQPTITLGGSVTITGAVGDADRLDSETVTLAWGDGTSSAAVVTETNGSGSFTATHSYTSLSAQQQLVGLAVTATATSEAGLTASASTTEVLKNPPPVVSGLVLSQSTIQAGGSVTLSGAVSDGNPNDAQSVVVNWGDGTSSAAKVTETNGSGTFTATHGYAGISAGKPNGAFVVTATATSLDGVSSSASINETVLVAPPVVGSLTQSGAKLQEGQTLSVSANFTDSAGNSNDTATIAWGDGTTSVATITENNGIGTVSGSHVYQSDAPANLSNTDVIVLTVADPDGLKGTATGSVTVASVAPVVSGLVLSQGTINLGGSVTLTGIVSDPNTLDAQTVNVTWGDGTSSSATVTESNGSGTFTATHGYGSIAPNQLATVFAISATATSKDGQTGAAGAALAVNNTPPVLSGVALSAAAVVAGGTVTVTGSVSDANTQDTQSIRFAWGDGSASSVTVADVHGSGTFSASHVYSGAAAPQFVNTETIGVTAISLAGLVSSATVSETVVNLGGAVPGFVLASGGFATLSSSGGATPTVSSGGLLVVSSGGSARGAVVSAGGVALVAVGGTASGSTVAGGGYQLVSGGGAASSTSVASGGIERVFAGGVTSGETVLSGGAEIVSSGGVAVATNVASGGTETISAGGVASGVSLVSGGSVTALAGGAIVGAISAVGAGGIAFISSAGTVSGGSVISGATLTVAAGAFVQGGLALSGGTAVISAAVGGTQAVTFVGAGGDLALGNPGGFAALITGFGSGDLIDVLGLQFGSETFVAAAGGTSGTLTLLGSGGQVALAFGGSFTSASFSVTSDGAGGSLVRLG